MFGRPQLHSTEVNIGVIPHPADGRFTVFSGSVYLLVCFGNVLWTHLAVGFSLQAVQALALIGMESLGVLL